MRTNEARAGRLVAALVLACAASGCSTYTRHARYFRGDYDDRERPVCQVYAGSLKDLGLVLTGAVGCEYHPLVQVVGLIDLPLSLAADSALLPVAIGETVALAVRRRRPQSGQPSRVPPDDDRGENQ